METEQLGWKSHGLPSDDLSVQNAAIILNCLQSPLIIDPTGRVGHFLEKQQQKAERLKAAQADLITQVCAHLILNHFCFRSSWEFALGRR
jgi:hypothetical protein